MILNTSLHMIMYCTWTCYMYPAWHAPKMDNPENNLNI